MTHLISSKSMGNFKNQNKFLSNAIAKQLIKIQLIRVCKEPENNPLNTNKKAC